MISKHRPLWILMLGFALVITTLAYLAWLGFRQAESLRRQAATLVKDHLFTAHLVDTLELEQRRASNLLLTVSHSPAKPEGVQLTLREFESALPGIVSEGEKVLPSPLWLELTQAAAAYVAALQQMLIQRDSKEASVRLLQQRYDTFVHLTDQIIKQDTLRAAAIETRIERDLGELANETGGLLGGAFLLALACAFVTIRFTLNALRRLEWQSQELNRVSWHLIQGQEEAARRFSHEMHDELGQSLTGLKAMLTAVTPAEFAERRAGCLHLLDEAIGNVRELSQLLRPVILDDFGLAAALRWLAERFQERTRIEVEVQSELTERLTDEVETHLFRITQEALTNVARHAAATRVLVTLERRGTQVRLSITDNGIGLSRKQPKGPSLGLVSMRARAEQLGGTFTLTGEASGGVSVSVSAPARIPRKNLEKSYA